MPSHLSEAAAHRSPVLVLGGGITGLGVLRILARNRIPRWLVATAADLAFASRHARPAPRPVGAGPAVESDLAGYLMSLPVDSAVLIPCSDAVLLQIALLSPEVRRRFRAAVAPPEVLHRALDKSRFAELLGSIGVSHPRSWTVAGAADLASVPQNVYQRAFLKPRDSQAFFARYGVKGFWVKSREAALLRLEELAPTGLGVQLQEYVPGPPTAHVFVDGYAAAGGDIRALLVRRRLRMYPTDFGNS
ncbi:MAG TPA: hypothetical protein VGA78_05170, partial [Gemmatimonadales bacterium]